MAIAGDPDSIITGPTLQALRKAFSPSLTQAELARQMRVVRQRVATIESQAAVPAVSADRYVQALEVIAQMRLRARP